MRPVRTYEFIVVLKRSSTKVIDIISLLMLGISVITFTYQFSAQFVEAGNAINSKNSLLLVWIFGIIGWVLMCRYQQKRGIAPYYRFAIMIAGWGWFMNSQTMWLSIIFLIAAILEKPIKVQPEYAFDDDCVVYNSFPQKSYPWNEVENVVLKDGLLTIDFKNNKIVQRDVNDEVSKQVEFEFNSYCKVRLKASIS